MSTTAVGNRTGPQYANGQHQPPAYEPPEPDRWALVWRFKWVILGAAILIAVATLAISKAATPTYKSTAVVRVTLPGRPSTTDGIRASNDLASQDAQIVTSDAVLRDPAKRFGMSIGALRAKVSAGTVAGQNLVQINATGDKQAAAQQRADAVAKSFTDYLGSSTKSQADALNSSLADRLSPVDSQIASLEKQLRLARKHHSSRELSIEQSLSTLLGQRAQTLGQFAQSATSGSSAVSVVQNASSAAQTAPKPMLYTLVAFLVGLLVVSQLCVLVGTRRR